MSQKFSKLPSYSVQTALVVSGSYVYCVFNTTFTIIYISRERFCKFTVLPKQQLLVQRNKFLTKSFLDVFIVSNVAVAVS